MSSLETCGEVTLTLFVLTDLSPSSRHRLTCRMKETPRGSRGAGESLLRFGAWNRLLGNSLSTIYGWGTVNMVR